MNTHNSLDEQFVFTGKAKTWSLAAIVVGVITIAGGFLLGHGERTFASLLLCGYYFACVCTAGVFFCALQYVAQAGWSASLLRVPQAFAKGLPIAAVTLLVIIGAGLFLTHTTEVEGKQVVAPFLYKIWHAPGVTTPGSENYDPILAGKSGFLNVPFFFIRLIAFLGS